MVLKKTGLLFLLLITACSTSRIIRYTALPKMVEGEGVLFMNIKNMTEIQQYALFASARRMMSKTNEVKFLPEYEYHLINRGIGREHLYGNDISDSILSMIAMETNSRYMLYIENVNSKQGETFGSYTPMELDRYNAPYYEENETHNASITFKLIDTKNYLTEGKFRVNTDISPLVIQDEEGGETRINPTTRSLALVRAFEKGIRQLRKGVVKRR